MAHDPEVEAAYPRRWIGRVEVETIDGRRLEGSVDEPKGDPGNTLSRGELADKALRLAEFSGAASAAEVRALVADVFAIADAPRLGRLLPLAPPGLAAARGETRGESRR